MFAKYITAGLVGTALLASAAFAQNQTTTGDRATTAQSSAAQSTALDPAQLKDTWRASKVVGLYVYNNNNENIGSINDLMMEKNGSIKAVVIGVGGFLGVGEHLVAIPYDKIKFSDEPVSSGTASRSSSTTTGSATSTTSSSTSRNQWYPDHAVFNATKDELKAMPEFKYSS
jgi:sporulation protein YlmC with PRC-barrel domain